MSPTSSTSREREHGHQTVMDLSLFSAVFHRAGAKRSLQLDDQPVQSEEQLLCVTAEGNGESVEEALLLKFSDLSR